MTNTTKKSGNASQHDMKQNPNDEFYTQMSDIEKEVLRYTDQFNGKAVFCNCDDAKYSNFYRFFYNNFKKLGLKSLTGGRNEQISDISNAQVLCATCNGFKGSK